MDVCAGASLLLRRRRECRGAGVSSGAGVPYPRCSRMMRADFSKASFGISVPKRMGSSSPEMSSAKLRGELGGIDAGSASASTSSL